MLTMLSERRAVPTADIELSEDADYVRPITSLRMASTTNLPTASSQNAAMPYPLVVWSFMMSAAGIGFPKERWSA